MLTTLIVLPALIAARWPPQRVAGDAGGTVPRRSPEALRPRRFSARPRRAPRLGWPSTPRGDAMASRASGMAAFVGLWAGSAPARCSRARARSAVGAGAVAEHEGADGFAEAVGVVGHHRVAGARDDGEAPLRQHVVHHAVRHVGRQDVGRRAAHDQRGTRDLRQRVQSWSSISRSRAFCCSGSPRCERFRAAPIHLHSKRCPVACAARAAPCVGARRAAPPGRRARARARSPPPNRRALLLRLDVLLDAQPPARVTSGPTSTITSPAIRSGCRPANSVAMRPPSEWPITTSRSIRARR